MLKWAVSVAIMRVEGGWASILGEILMLMRGEIDGFLVKSPCPRIKTMTYVVRHW